MKNITGLNLQTGNLEAKWYILILSHGQLSESFTADHAGPHHATIENKHILGKC